MSSSLLLQQCPACLVRLTCIVFVMGGKWPYSWCLVGCCLRIDREIKTMINNTIREVSVTLLEIKTEAVNDEFIKTTKQKLSRGDVSSDIYSVCDDVLLYRERISLSLKLSPKGY